jgi:hypothetical protein
MQWLHDLFVLLVNAIGGTGAATGRFGAIVVFFLYDFVKIGILLCFLIFIISFIQSYFPPERTKKLLAKKKGIGANAFGALLGTVTPFCSCSSIPIFIGFTRAGLSSGVTFSFLISSPLVDLGAFVLLVGAFGLPVAIAYVAVGLVLATIGGTLIEKTGLGKEIEPFVLDGRAIDADVQTLTFKDRAVYAKDQMFATYKKVVLYIAIGVALGAIIHNVIPQAWIETVLGNENPFSVLIATLIGVPMYADIFGTIPVAEALYAKGAGLGTVLAFMMAVTALSLPSIVMLKKVVKWKLLAGFMTIVVTGIILIGYLFNAIGHLF